MSLNEALAETVKAGQVEARGLWERFSLRVCLGLLTALAISVGVSIILGLALKRSQVFGSEAQQRIKGMEQQIKTLEQQRTILYRDRDVIVNRIQTNTVILAGMESNRNEKESRYSNAGDMLAAFAIYTNRPGRDRK